MNLPVLIYVAKKGCPACVYYDTQWTEVKERLRGLARFVKFTCDPNVAGMNIPPPLEYYVTWFPTILIAGPKSYFRIFTPDDKVNEDEYSDNYTIRAKKFNAVQTDKGFEFAGRGNTADATIMWFNQIVNTVSQFDEPLPPRRFAHLF